MIKKRKTTGIPSLQSVKRLILPILEQYPIRRAAVFGSVAMGTARSSSDVDVLLEFDRRSTIGLFAFVRLKGQLEKKVGRKIDLVTYDALHPLLRKDILNQQKIIYEKGR